MYYFLCCFLAKSTVGFYQSTYSVDEGAGSLWPLIVFSGLSLTDITVRILTVSGSAGGKFVRTYVHMDNKKYLMLICFTHHVIGGGLDYVSGPYSVTIPAGKNNGSFRISITNDNIRENNETFYLVIDSSSLPDGVIVGTPSQAIITIVDETS